MFGCVTFNVKYYMFSQIFYKKITYTALVLIYLIFKNECHFKSYMYCITNKENSKT